MDESNIVVRNIPEKLILVVDTCCDQGESASLVFDQIKAALRLFLHLKARVACADHRLELWSVSDVLFQVTSGDYTQVLQEINSLAPLPPRSGDVNLFNLSSQLVETLCDGSLGSSDAPLFANPFATARLIYVSAQHKSSILPSSKSHFEVLAANPLFYFDALLVIPDKEKKTTPLEASIRALPFEATGRSHIHTLTWSECSDRLFERMAALLAHPLQRSSHDLLTKQ